MKYQKNEEDFPSLPSIQPKRQKTDHIIMNDLSSDPIEALAPEKSSKYATPS